MKLGFWGRLRTSLLNKIILLFIIFLVPLYILGSVIFSWSMENTKEKIVNSELIQLNYYMDKFEKEIERISIIQFEFWNDRDLLNISSFGETMNLFDYQTALKNLQQRIFLLKNSSEYVESASINLFSINKKISTAEGITQKTEETSEFTQESMFNSLFGWNGKNLVINVKGPAFYSLENSDYPFLIQAEISSKTILDDFKQFDVLNNYGQSYTVLMDKSNQYNIARNNNFGSGEDLPYQVFEDKYKDTDQGIFETAINGRNVFCIYVRSKLLNSVILRIIPETYFINQFKRYVIWFTIFSAVSLSIIVLFFLMIFKQVIEPLQKIVQAFKEVENGNMDLVIKHNKHDEFSFLYRGFNKMIENIKYLFEQVFQYKMLAQQAEMKRLQSQINPHFLYNSFYILHRLAKMDDSESVADFTYKLANYYQFITRNAEDEVTLEKEAGYAKIYTEIQEIRFNNRIHVDFGEVPDIFKNFSIPRMVLQPVIENAFEHGLKNKVKDGMICVSFEGIDNGISILIEDNGDSVTEQDIEKLSGKLESDNKSEETTAIINIHRRLKMRYGNESGIRVSRGKWNGFCVNIIIMCKEAMDVQAVNS